MIHGIHSHGSRTLDRYVLYNQEIHRFLLIWVGKDLGKLHCRCREVSFYRNSIFDAHIILYLQQFGFYDVT